MPRPAKTVIGRTDRIDFPDFGWTDVPAKVDTGAYTSALYATDVRVADTSNGPRLSFRLPGVATSGGVGKRERYVTGRFTQRLIRNSFGVAELRYVIQTRIRLFGRMRLVEFSLADRANLRYPVLLGRKLLRHRFVVDVTLIDVSFSIKSQVESLKSKV